VKQIGLERSAANRLRVLRSEWDLSESATSRLSRLVLLLASEPGAPTSVTAPEEAIDIHVADSLSGLSDARLARAESVVDIGSGAGLPGLVLAAVMPQAQVDMLESVRKKCAFIEHAASELELPDARAVCARAEHWGAGEGAGAYAAATARAVGRLATVVEYAAPLLELGGILVAWKGRRDTEEESAAERAAAILGMTPVGAERVEPFAGSRNLHLHIYRKESPCPEGYPRRPGMARKRPLGETSRRP
jgi:16S rRNA (guanine527-N7)-methyltransferase